VWPAELRPFLTEPFDDREVPGRRPETGEPAAGARSPKSLETVSVAVSNPALARQEFFLPVHGLVRLSPDEVDVVDHPAFQHLRHVYQLGQTYLVYPGATHSRFEHALGTRHVIDLLIEALARNYAAGIAGPNSRAGRWLLDEALRPLEERFVRLGALLHDIGHLPAGHTLEDELSLLGAHDKGERLRLVWDRAEWAGGRPPQTLREVIEERFGEDAAATGLVHDKSGAALTATETVELMISKEPPKVRRTDEFRVDVCRDLIGNTICADLLDYLHRDWYHLGKERFFDTRLLEYIEIRAVETEEGREAHLVINLRSGSKIRTDAVTAILDLLESRYQLAEIALFHRTKLAAAAMLERAIAEIDDQDGRFLSGLAKRLLDATDTEMLGAISQAADRALRRAELQPAQRVALEAARELIRSLRVRRLHKHLMSQFELDLHRTTRAVQDRYAGIQANKPAERRRNAKTAAANRLNAVRQLERDFGMPPGSIVMYCPGRNMNSKIAEVRVLIHDEIYKLDDFEGDERSDRGITGGHLAAQKDRFRRLWRVLFAIDPIEKDRLEEKGLLQVLGRAIELCVLRKEPAIGTLDDAVAALARELTALEGSPLHGRAFSPAIAARQEGQQHYPGGALSLLDHTEPTTAS
jgi:HD superfamily phosphohydrolase